MEKRKFVNNNIKLGGVWEFGKQGNLRSMVLNKETEERLNNVVFESGGRFVITFTKPEAKQENAKLPEAFLEYQPKAEVDAEKQRIAEWRSKQTSDSL